MTGIIAYWTLVGILVTIITTIVHTIATCCTWNAFVRIRTPNLVGSARSISYGCLEDGRNLNKGSPLTAKIGILITHITTIVV